MISLVARTGRKGVLAGVLSIALCFIILAVIRDLNAKLLVMTASNQNYQKMTDSQVEKIAKLQKTLKEEQEFKEVNTKQHQSNQSRMKKAHDDERRQMQSRISTMEKELSTVQREHQNLQNEFNILSQKHIQNNHHLSRVQKEHEQLEAENGRLKHENDVHFAQITQDRDSYKQQYLALFKQHQSDADALQIFEKEKERLQLQLNDVSRLGADSPRLSSKRAHAPSGSSSSTAKTGVLSQPLAEPVHPEHEGVPKAGPKVAVKPSTSVHNPRVGAEPPHAQNLVVPPHELMKEDVMEAPKPQDFQHYLHQPRRGNQIAQPVVKHVDENMDRAVDGVKQANPGILDQIHPNGDQGDNAEEEENDQDDEVDGVIQGYHKAPTNLRREEIEPEENEDEDDNEHNVNYDQNVIHGFRRHHDQGNRAFQPADFGMHGMNFEPNQLRQYAQAPPINNNARFIQRPALPNRMHHPL